MVSEAHAVGGAEIYLERLAATFTRWRPTLGIVQRPALESWSDHLISAGFDVVRIAPGWRGVRALGAWVAGQGIDLIHLNLPSSYDGNAGFLAWWLRRATGLPIVVTEHLTRIPRSRRRRWAKQRTESAIAARIVVSEASRAALRGEDTDRPPSVVIPNGVPDPGRPEPLPPERPLRVGALATLEPRKQLDRLVRAVAAVSDSGAIRLTLAGEGPERDALARLIDATGTGDRVFLVGRVDPVAPWLAGQHLLALPSRLEGMSLGVLEAYASGRGVLAAAVPGMDEIVEPDATGFLLDPEHDAPWTQALETVLREPERVARWGAAARTRYEREFTLGRCAGATEALYDRVIEGGTR